MAENPTNDRHSRIVTLSAPADRDQSIIYAYTADQWGERQAEIYLDFLDDVMQQLANQPELAPVVPNRKTTRVYVARWNNARDGHRIFFRENDEGIYVMRILHTAMNPGSLQDTEFTVP